MSQNREEWQNKEQEERMEYYLFKTNKKATPTALASVSAYHKKGYETNLELGVSYLTSEETVNTFGIDSETKVACVVVNLGCGWKWGDASSRTTERAGHFTLPSNLADCLIIREGKVMVQEYYLLVRKVSRPVNKDKKGKITYGRYTVSIDNNLSGYFNTFDFDSGVSYSNIKG